MARVAVPLPVSSSVARRAPVHVSFAVPGQALFRRIATKSQILRTPAYVSTATQSLTVTVSPQSGTPSASVVVPCASTCDATVEAPVGHDTLTLALTDAADGTGNALSLLGSTSVNVQANTDNTFSLTANPVLDHASLALGAATVTGTVATTIPVTVTAYDADNRIIVGPGNFVDVSGNPASIGLSATLVTAGGQGTITLSQTSLSGSESMTAPITATYDGNWLASSTIALQLPADIAARSVGTSSSISVQPSVIETSHGFVPSDHLYGIIVGPDQNFWIAEFAGNRIARLTPTGSLTEFSAGISPNAEPNNLVVGPDGNIWFSEYNHPAIGRITPGGVITEFTAGMSGNSTDLVVGSDGNIWFSNPLSGVGTITTSGAITVYPTCGGYGIASSPNGNLFFACHGSIGELTTSGSLLGYFSAGLIGGASTNSMTRGPDGNVWFCDFSGGVGKITPAGVITEYTIGLPPGSSPRSIVSGPDGALWFVDQGAVQLGRITTSGQITMYDASYGFVQANGLFGLTFGPSNNLYLTASNYGLATFAY